MKVWDLHCDTLSELRRAEKNGTPASFAHNDLHIDLEKLQAGDYMLQCLAAFVNLADPTPGADPLVTALDDGTIPNGWGSAEMDDEGTPTAKNILIENGILRSYLVDRLNSRRMHTAITGSSRRQDYRFAPTSRMTNTFIANGKSTPEEIIANTEFGLYAKQMGGGSVDPATGSFNFAVLEGYMIRNGRIAEPVRGATLIGKGAEVLRDIDMVGNNLKRAQGMCGSKSGSIPTDVGQPMIRVSSMTVGGRG